MTPTRQKAGIAVVLLALAGALGLVRWWHAEQRVSEPVSPVAAQPPSSESSNTVVSTVQQATVPSSAPESVLARPEDAIVSEPDDESSDESSDEAAVEKPSPKVIAVIREIKKPTPDEGKVTSNPDGSYKMSLGNRYMSVPVATRGQDGKVHVNYHGEKFTEEKNNQKKE
ncbi:MAG TPA: hypothetical protein PLH12_06215 [Pseudomonadales bacterium]|jgi:hypothetical protein|nr:hypothetical protein [Pseudomonadales bacterium]